MLLYTSTRNACTILDDTLMRRLHSLPVRPLPQTQNQIQMNSCEVNKKPGQNVALSTCCIFAGTRAKQRSFYVKLTHHSVNYLRASGGQISLRVAFACEKSFVRGRSRRFGFPCLEFKLPSPSTRQTPKMRHAIKDNLNLA